MNVADLKLCKELYELSGWKDVEEYWEYYSFKDDALLKKSAPGNVFPDNKMLPEDITPAYDLGYLLRKLHDGLIKAEKMNDIELFGWGNWKVYTKDKDDKEIAKTGDTPEDAACKLAIELWKQGILK